MLRAWEEHKGDNMDKLIATYDQDSKRYHRYTIDESQGIVGNLYIPKDAEIPKELTITLRVKSGVAEE